MPTEEEERLKMSLPRNQSLVGGGEPQKSQAQIDCEAKGGKWDATNQTCIMPNQVKTKEGFIDPDPEVAGIRISGPTKFVSQEQLNEFRKRQRAKSDKEAAKILSEGGRASGDIRRETELTEARQQEIEAEKQRLIEEETPVRRELSPDLSQLEKTPVVGGIFGILKTASIAKDLDLDQLKPEELRTLALSEIERQETERGLTGSELLGSFVEATGLGKIEFFGLTAKDLVETPSGNAREAKSNLLKEKRRISNIETNVKMGYLPVSVAQDQIDDIEENVQRLESRIRMLIYNSAELKFNSDFVNTIETEILATREKLFQSKQNVLTGAITDPTELAIWMKMKSLEGDSE